MYRVELYGRVRRACHVDGMSIREAARLFGLHRDTVRKMLAFSVPPGYRRAGPAPRPMLDPFTGVPGGTSTFEATAFQPTLGTIGPFVGDFTDPSGPGPRNHGTINAPALLWNVGKIFPEPIRLRIVTFGPNVIEWDAIFMLPGLGVGLDSPGIAAPQVLRLRPAAPNPFRSVTSLRFALTRAGPRWIPVSRAAG